MVWGFREVRSFVSVRRMRVADGMPNQHLFLTIPTAHMMTSNFGKKSPDGFIRRTRHASFVGARQSTLSSAHIIGRLPDDDFDGKPNKNSDRSANSLPFA